jgi:hypothetical protein
MTHFIYIAVETGNKQWFDLKNCLFIGKCEDFGGVAGNEGRKDQDPQIAQIFADLCWVAPPTRPCRICVSRPVR